MQQNLVILFISDEQKEHDLFSMALNLMGIKYSCFFAVDNDDIIHHIKDHQPDIICFNSTLDPAGNHKLIKALNSISSTNIITCGNNGHKEQLNKVLTNEIICIESEHKMTAVIKIIKQIIESRFEHLKTLID